MPSQANDATLTQVEQEKTRLSASEIPTDNVERRPSDKERSGSKLDESPTQTLSSSESIIVDWDGPEDPMNPKNWPKSKKWAATLTVAIFTFVSPVASSMIAPGAPQVAKEFGVTNGLELNMITSIFVLGFAIGPLLMGPLSEIYGRSRTIQYGNLFFLAFNLACGFAQNQTQLIVCRFFAGIGGSSPLTIGGAVVGDTFPPEERGKAMATYAIGPMIGPAIGPLVGAWIAQRVSWRWIFWSSSIFDVVVQVAGIILLQETFPPVLLERKARRMAKSARLDPEKGSGKPPTFHTIYESDTRNWKYIVRTALVRPFMLFIREPIVQLLGAYMAFIYGIFYLFITTMPEIFMLIYKESTGITGLHYLALGLGTGFASWFNSKTMDKIYMHFKRKNNGIGEPEYRIPPIVPASIFFPVGMLMAGWAAQEHVHWIVIDIGLFCVGTGMILAFQAITIYIVDVFTLYAASGIAAVSCLRSLAGFGFPLFASAMFDRLGYGKGNTILACVAIVIGCPAPWLLWFYGKKIRSKSRFARKT